MASVLWDTLPPVATLRSQFSNRMPLPVRKRSPAAGAGAGRVGLGAKPSVSIGTARKVLVAHGPDRNCGLAVNSRSLALLGRNQIFATETFAPSSTRVTPKPPLSTDAEAQRLAANSPYSALTESWKKYPKATPTVLPPRAVNRSRPYSLLPTLTPNNSST